MGFTKEPVARSRGVGAPSPRGTPLHEKLFYRPLLEAVAGCPARRAAHDRGGGAAARRARLRRPGGALRHLEALTSGLTRPRHPARACCRRCSSGSRTRPTRTPDCSASADQREPRLDPLVPQDAARRGQVAERLARCWPPPRYATDLLEREPRACGCSAGTSTPLGSERSWSGCGLGRSTGRRRRGGALDPGDPRRELFRIAVGELFGEIDVATVGAALSRLTDATLEATLDVAGRWCASSAVSTSADRMAIVAMGRYGGFELSYGSDADVMFVHDRWATTARRPRRTPMPWPTSCAGC
jgi:glutamate-ammonia-ligase adenylyltransferase